MLDKFLEEKIKGEKVILFGELHGTKEIPLLLLNFFDYYARNHDFNIAIEIQSENQDFIDLFFKTGSEANLRDMPFFKYGEKTDGRNSLEYFNLIKEIKIMNSLYKRDIRIFCVDTSDLEDYRVQNKRENKMAENILKTLSNKITFVILGSIHASKESLVLNNENIIPTGKILSNKLGDDMISILLFPKQGQHFNIEIKLINNKVSDIEEFGKNYNYVYIIEKVTPATFFKASDVK